jgi:hypothetical protein
VRETFACRASGRRPARILFLFCVAGRRFLLDPRFGGPRLREMSPLPIRVGERPRTTPTNPHTQLDQQPTDLRWVKELAERVFALPGVVEEPSRISVPGARALVLAQGEAVGPPEAFLIDREFAHLHPAPDHSLHAMLPTETVTEAVSAGWAEPHPSPSEA